MIAVEAALMEQLKEMGVCESLWYVYVKPEIRRERLRISRGYSEEKMDSIFASDTTEEVDRFKDVPVHVIVDNEEME